MIHANNLRKHNSKKSDVDKYIIESLIHNKKCKMCVAFKEEKILNKVEYLRRWYDSEESMIRLPKMYQYYKNYIRFFCKPRFRCLKSYKLLVEIGDGKAELYYKNTYGYNHSKEELLYDKVFSDSIKIQIDKESILEEINKMDVTNDTIADIVNTICNTESTLISTADRKSFGNVINSKYGNLQIKSKQTVLPIVVNSYNFKPKVVIKQNPIISQQKTVNLRNKIAAKNLIINKSRNTNIPIVKSHMSSLMQNSQKTFCSKFNKLNDVHIRGYQIINKLNNKKI